MKIPILMYHDIYENSPSGIKGSSMHPSYFVSLEAFESQLQVIADFNLLPITLCELSKDKEKTNNSKKIIILSFDDGYVGNYLHAFPALKEQRMTATFFCAVGSVGQKNMMAWSQIKEMASQGMSIQSHGFSHKPLASLNEKDIYEDLRISKKELENKLGEKVSYLSLPHGSFTRYVIQAAKEIGYERICTSLIGYNKGHEYCLKRILVRSDYGPEKYEALITGQSNFILPKFCQEMKSLIKNTMGHENYLKLYHYFYGIRV